MSVPPLAYFCICVLADSSDPVLPAHRVPASAALLAALPDPRNCSPRLWASLARRVHPLPPHLHDYALAFAHPDLPLLQSLPHAPDFSLVTLLSLPNCAQLRDDDVPRFRALHRLLALDLRGCSISSYAFTALARGLASAAPSGLRLLGLHGCPNIDDDILGPLHAFPLLSAVDLRFTRCTPSAVTARFSPLGFCPFPNNSLFHPAPLSLALCTLEKIALTASPPISLYSCPPASIFRLHINQLSYRPPPTRTAQDTPVFIPLLQEPPNDAPLSPSEPAPALVSPQPVSNSNVSSFYQNAPVLSGKTSILPLSAQAVQSSHRAKPDPLAIARSPPPWEILCSPVDSPPKQPNTHALDDPLRINHARLRKRGSDPVADMAHQFATKRPKAESEFVRARSQAIASARSRNPFARSTRSVFAESSSTNPDDKPPPSVHVHESQKESRSDMQLRACRSLPLELSLKPLRPITTFRPPILPKELLPSSPRYVSKPKKGLKQTRLWGE